VSVFFRVKNSSVSSILTHNCVKYKRWLCWTVYVFSLLFSQYKWWRRDINVRGLEL